MARFARWITTSTACALLAACATHPSTSTSTTPDNASAHAGSPAVASDSHARSTARAATVILMSASGSLVSGRLNAAPMADGVHFTGEIGGLGKGASHAIHIHEKGDCSAVDGSSAGGHFNPAGKPHGKVSSNAHHGGDMDNVVANPMGVAQVSVHAAGVTLGGHARNDIAGRAIVVHASADDYQSQPAGNAGARVACGIITVTP